MRNLRLYTNEAVPREARQRLATDLGKVLPVTSTEVIHQRSEGVTSIVQLVLEASQWVTPLKAAASYFLYQVGKSVGGFSSQIGKRAANAVVDRWEEKNGAGDDSDDKALREVAKALADVCRATDDRTLLRVGLPIPDDFMSCCVELEDPSEEDIALVVSLLVVQADQIDQTIKEAAQGHDILGPVHLSLQEDGRFEARWKDQQFGKHHVVIGDAA